MDTQTALNAFAALAHDSRLSIIRLLIKAGPEGLSAGVIGQHLNIMASALSFHLNYLAQCKLISAQHQGRRIIYAACFDIMTELIQFLSENCCEGKECSLVDSSALIMCSQEPRS
ncbi:MAG TPA: helix-turn-helix transcriptional regulator [Burkholderiales bacterium]|nr:helix-turn-helix transcriptional regulator [Burkholderiales bacterium]